MKKISSSPKQPLFRNNQLYPFALEGTALSRCQRRIYHVWSGFTLLAVLLLSAAQAGQLDHWHWRSPVPFATSLFSVTFGAGKFVAVGEDGVIHLSADGAVWSEGQRPVTDSLHKVIFDNDQFVAVGDRGAIVTSPDGFTWTKQSSGATNTFLSVTYGNGKYLACGVAGQIAFSSNGSTWSPGFVGTNTLTWATAGNGIYILPGYGALEIRVSSDGLGWSSVAVPVDSPTYPWTPTSLFQIEFANGQFVALAQPFYRQSPNLAYSLFLRSTNGITWTPGASFGYPRVSPRFLTFANNAHWTLLYGAFLGYTEDGSASTGYEGPSDVSDANGIAYGNGTYVLVANTGKIWTSTKFTPWTPAYVPNRNTIRQMVRGPNGYLAVSHGTDTYNSDPIHYPGPIFTSADGLAFTPLPTSPTLAYRGIGFDGSNLVAIAELGGLYTSTNGINWVQRTSNASQTLMAVCRGVARWVAVGAGGTIITSPSGAAWTLRFSGTAYDLQGVAYGNGVYVAVGVGGNILTSTDGATWDVQDSGTIAPLYVVQFLNGQFYAGGANGTILSSTDGTTWNAQYSGVSRTLTGLAWDNGYYVAAGSDSVLLRSTNGVNWVDVSTNLPAGVGLNSLALLGGSFWVMGDNGAILQSDTTDGRPRLTATMLPGNHGFQLKLILNQPEAYRIQAITSMDSGWQDVFTVTNPVITHGWTDIDAPQYPSRFYRVKRAD